MDDPFTGNATGMQNTSIDKAIYTMQIILMSKPNPPPQKGERSVPRRDELGMRSQTLEGRTKWKGGWYTFP